MSKHLDTKLEHEYLEDVNAPNNKDLDSPSFDHHDPSNFHIRSTEEKQAELAAAQLVDPGISFRSARGIQFILMATVVFMCGGDSGMDATVMSAINSMTQFQKYFGINGAASKTGIVFGIYTIGGVVAALPGAYLPDKVGRRRAMFIGNSILIIGALLSANARNMHMFLAGRFLTGFGCTIGALAAKSYMAEITSPHNRGRFMGVLNSFYYVGQILASGISVPTGRFITEWAWRTPLMVQVAPAFFNVAFILFLPESPRWLYSRGHKEEAARVLAKWHSRDADVNSPLIQFELREIEENLAVSRGDKVWWDLRPLFRDAPARYRMGLTFMDNCWGQLSGNGLITYFLTILLKQAGIVSTDRQRILNFVNSITSMIGALTGAALVDKIGRRKLMLSACVSCFLGMTIVGLLLSPIGTHSQARASAGIAFIFLFMVFFSFGWTPLQGLYPSEVLSFEMRAKGLATQGLVTNAVSCINTFGMPTALAKLNYKTYFIFAAWDIVGFCTVYYFAVETRTLTLEDIDAVFHDENPKKYAFELLETRRIKAKEGKEAMGAGA